MGNPGLTFIIFIVILITILTILIIIQKEKDLRLRNLNFNAHVSMNKNKPANNSLSFKKLTDEEADLLARNALLGDRIANKRELRKKIDEIGDIGKVTTACQTIINQSDLAPEQKWKMEVKSLFVLDDVGQQVTNRKLPRSIVQTDYFARQLAQHLNPFNSQK